MHISVEECNQLLSRMDGDVLKAIKCVRLRETLRKQQINLNCDWAQVLQQFNWNIRLASSHLIHSHTLAQHLTEIWLWRWSLFSRLFSPIYTKKHFHINLFVTKLFPSRKNLGIVSWNDTHFYVQTHCRFSKTIIHHLHVFCFVFVTACLYISTSLN